MVKQTSVNDYRKVTETKMQGYGYKPEKQEQAAVKAGPNYKSLIADFLLIAFLAMTVQHCQHILGRFEQVKELAWLLGFGIEAGIAYAAFMATNVSLDSFTRWTAGVWAGLLIIASFSLNTAYYFEQDAGMGGLGLAAIFPMSLAFLGVIKPGVSVKKVLHSNTDSNSTNISTNNTDNSTTQSNVPVPLPAAPAQPTSPVQIMPMPVRGNDVKPSNTVATSKANNNNATADTNAKIALPDAQVLQRPKAVQFHFASAKNGAGLAVPVNTFAKGFHKSNAISVSVQTQAENAILLPTATNANSNGAADSSGDSAEVLAGWPNAFSGSNSNSDIVRGSDGGIEVVGPIAFKVTSSSEGSDNQLLLDLQSEISNLVKTVQRREVGIKDFDINVHSVLTRPLYTSVIADWASRSGSNTADFEIEIGKLGRLVQARKIGIKDFDQKLSELL